ncbi:hypothetical protein G6F50_016619 [Rhizopus delemar]|uniref:Secreted protein n=1 Tax=Rhizopus delemar TaxID=936053 RepID=A0A9P6XSP4_9FUNG|nr:hypothetical protein G6F50_016619 [Rhizopus delemar]
MPPSFLAMSWIITSAAVQYVPSSGKFHSKTLPSTDCDRPLPIVSTGTLSTMALSLTANVMPVDWVSKPEAPVPLPFRRS